MVTPGFNSPPAQCQHKSKQIPDKAGGHRLPGKEMAMAQAQTNLCRVADKLTLILGNMLICPFHFLKFHNPEANLAFNNNCVH